MSDSEDSESFLSADEGGDGDANESSDITLSSDSEPEEGGKAATGDLDSSDITLSSDEDKGAKQTTKKAPQDSGGACASIKDSKTRKDVAQVEQASDKAKESTDDQKQTNQQPCPKAEHSKDDKSSFDLSDVSSALPSSTHLETKKQGSAKSSTPAVQTADVDDPLKYKEVPAPNLEAPCSNSPAKPIQEALTPQVSKTVEYAPDQTPDPKGWGDLGDAAPLGQDASDSEGWGDLGDAVLPEDDTPKPDTPGGPDDWGWTGDREPAGPVATAHTEHSPQPAASQDRQQAATLPETQPSQRVSPAPAESEPAASVPERRRPERRERRGPLKLGAKKLGAKLGPAPCELSAPDREAGPTDGGAGVRPVSGRAADTQAAAARPNQAAASQHEEDQDGWGSWETWGTSLISSAVDVTKTVLETVETGFGAPDPEELARFTKEEQEQERQKQQQSRQKTQSQPAAAAGTAPAADDAAAGLGLGSWFGGVSRVLGQTSSLVVNTGLDTLEAIGKKTMHVLQDDQLGIHGTISQLSGQKPSLSQALREAREKRGDAVPGSPVRGGGGVTHPPTFSHLFDQCDGTVHLEALEMLSSRTQSRVTSAKSRVDEAAGILLDMIEDLCSPEELEEGIETVDFEAELSALVSRLSVPIKPTRLIIARSSAVQWLDSRPPEVARPREVLSRAVRAAAEVGAGLAEYLHKLAELQLVEGARDGVAAARHLARLAALVSADAGTLAARFAETLSRQEDERAAAATTDIYLEVSYLQKFCSDALRLMAPVLQMAALHDTS